METPISSLNKALILLFYAVMASAAAILVLSARAAEAGDRFYGALQPTLEHAQQNREAGCNVAVVSLAWDAFEPSPGKVDQAYVESITRKAKAFRALGYQLQLDLGTQYPPAWIFDIQHARYRNQYGDEFESDEPGKRIPNYIFNQALRNHLAGYFESVFSHLGTDWDWVRLGGGFYGEVNFPSYRYKDKDNCYWGFDLLAQGQVEGVAEGVRACPVPGWIPGTASPGGGDARRFLEWYLDSLRAYHDWQISTVRRWYSGPLCMLYGSWGIRPGWVDTAIRGNLDGTSHAERVGEIQSGYDWQRMIAGIRDKEVIVYCTWIDAPPKDCDDESPDPQRWSPVHWQAHLAREKGLKVWGENTGGGDLAAMQLTFERMKRYNLLGILWAFESELYAKSPKLATLEQLAELIERYK